MRLLLVVLVLAVPTAVATPSGQPLVSIVDRLEERCSTSHAWWNNPDCRTMGGRPFAQGAFAVCEPGGNQTLRESVAFADAHVDDTTTLLFPGTPLDGERICEEHWSTARALVTLP